MFLEDMEILDQNMWKKTFLDLIILLSWNNNSFKKIVLVVPADDSREEWSTKDVK